MSMTAYIPILFFSVLLFISYKKRGIDVVTYIIFMYVVTSLFSVVMKRLNLVSNIASSPSFYSTLVYCLLISLCFIPVSKFKSKELKGIYIPSEKFFNILTLFYFTAFLINLIIYWKDLIFIVSYGDWDALRKMISNGDSITITHVAGLVSKISTVFRFVGSISFVMMPVFFISIIFLKKPWWFSLLAILSTTNTILEGILGCDRSSTFRWVLLWGLNFVIFWPMLQRKAKRKISIVFSCIMFGVVSYFVSVTVSRFENHNTGVKGGLIEYAGQSYYNFCYLYDNYDNHEGFNTHYFFPAIHKYILHDYEGNVPLQQEMTQKSGIECGVFYTFLGSFIIDCNQIGPYVFVLLFLIIGAIVRSRNKRTSTNTISFINFMECYFMWIVLVYGIIAYPYVTPYHTISIILFLLVVSNINSNHYYSIDGQDKL